MTSQLAQKFKTYFTDIHPFTLTLYLVVFLYLFYQNTFFSSNLAMLYYRGIDDMAFHLYIKCMYEHSRFFALNGYAYGAVFWFPIAVLTYPFHILSEQANIDTPLIMVPRLLALSFTILSGYIMFKIAHHYTKDRIICNAIALLTILTPAAGAFATRFTTAPLVEFLSLLALYLCISSPILTKKRIILIACTAGAAMGAKLSAVLILPFIGIIMMDRLSYKVSYTNVAKALLFTFSLIISFVALGQPNTQNILEQIEKTKTLASEKLSFLQQIDTGIIDPFFGQAGTIALVSLSLLLAITRFRTNRDFAIIAAVCIVNLIYLALTIQMGPAYITIYATSFIPLLLLGLIYLERFKTPLKSLFLLAITAAILFSTWPSLLNNSGNIISWDLPSTLYKSPDLKEKLSIAQEVNAYIENTRNKDKNLLIVQDYRAPYTMSHFVKNVTLTLSYDNIIHSTTDSIPDILVMNKSSIGNLDNEAFHKLIADVSENVKEQYLQEREALSGLKKDNIFKGERYKLIFDYDKYSVYELVK